MSSYHGLCTYPHGGRATSLVWLSLTAATICTVYSIASCRLVVLEFSSTLGNFEDHFVNFDEAAAPETHEVGLGLFTWLLPNYYVDGDDDTITRATFGDWEEGSCQGYNTLQLNAMLQDSKFDAVRIMGVLSVLLTFSIFLFGLMLSCLSIASWQRYILCASCTVAGIFTGCILLMAQSGPCINTGQDSSCQLDEGGLVAIAAVMLWVCGALLTYFFLEPPTTLSRAEKYQQARRQKKKAAAMGKMRSSKDSKIDWNRSSRNNKNKKTKSMPALTTPPAKNSHSRSRSGSRTPSPKTPNTEKSYHSSFSMPAASPRNIVDDLNKAEKQHQHGRVVKHSGTRGATVAVPTMQQSQSRQSQQRKSQQGANNKSLETRYVPQTALANADRQQQSQSNRGRNMNRSMGMIDEKKDDDSDDYDCIPYQRPKTAANSSWTATKSMSSSVPPSPLEQPNQRYRSTSLPRQQPTYNGKTADVYQDYVQEVTRSRSQSSHGSRNSRNSTSSTRQSAVREALSDDLELQRPSNSWACMPC